MIRSMWNFPHINGALFVTPLGISRASEADATRICCLLETWILAALLSKSLISLFYNLTASTFSWKCWASSALFFLSLSLDIFPISTLTILLKRRGCMLVLWQIVGPPSDQEMRGCVLSWINMKWQDSVLSWISIRSLDSAPKDTHSFYFFPY